MRLKMYWLGTAVITTMLALIMYSFPIHSAADDKKPSKSDAETVAKSAKKAENKMTMTNKKTDTTEMKKVTRTEEEWRRILTPEQYRILREKGTERAFTGAFWDTETAGTYYCAGCGLKLFRSEQKFHSGCGWPSFWNSIDNSHIKETPDTTLGMVRTELTCERCAGHLGHVFEDGPPPTGLRYCINSESLTFVPDKPGTTPSDSNPPAAPPDGESSK